MKITPIGAAREVTGSCFHIQSAKAQILIDCGIFQGGTFAHSKNFEDFLFDVKKLDAVFVTHAHLDHTGRLPLLIKRGFKGKIFLTPPTIELTKLILADAVEIMAEDHKRYYSPMLFSQTDVKQTFNHMHPVADQSAIDFKDLTINFHNAGHILGSTFIQVTEKKGKTATFSGDLGNINTPILMQKNPLNDTDLLFIESTYGNRIHEDPQLRWQELKQVVTKTIKQDGVLLIPAFAIERTQELLYEFNNLVENRLIPYVDIYMDSPMASEATDIFKKFPKYYSKKALRQIASGDKLFDFPGLQITRERDESKSINTAPWPKIIIAGAGMMNGGRILHHLIRYLGNKRCTVLIIGYQAQGTLGRKLYNGERRVRVLNEFIDVKAKILSIGGYSAHADQNMLIDWIKSAKTPPQQILCTHGEPDAAAALATRIKEELNIKSDTPRPNETITL